jgi:DHA3 family tetracycline resistance protein-like MFS transporter
VWATLKQRHVPASMLGRVSSLDWLISIGLLPLSFALTAPVTAAIGARWTLVGAGVGGAAITLAALYLPGMRDVEREEPEPVAARELLPVDVVVVATVVHAPRSAGVSAGRSDPW